MSLRLSSRQVEQLVDFVAKRITISGCDHSRRFCQEWAAEQQVDWDDLADILDTHGSFCDCEAVCNLPDEGTLEVPQSYPDDASRPTWHLPLGFQLDRAAVFQKIIVSRDPSEGKNTYTTRGEWLVPARHGAKPRKRVRKLCHFFIGCDSGLPSEVGIVAEVPPMSAEEFSRIVRRSGLDDLKAFGDREAGFVLSRIAQLTAGQPVGTNFNEKVAVASKHLELAVHRVILRR